ncbi:hypothetical protein VNO80_21149 [Phaseolus coccineus]|uniref:Uncharacterized protein n=1 Tax=Phaseolus coccineus TaxID=3886 RepID=A0AAN9QTT8_PHACN
MVVIQFLVSIKWFVFEVSYQRFLTTISTTITIQPSSPPNPLSAPPPSDTGLDLEGMSLLPLHNRPRPRLLVISCLCRQTLCLLRCPAAPAGFAFRFRLEGRVVHI